MNLSQRDRDFLQEVLEHGREALNDNSDYLDLQGIQEELLRASRKPGADAELRDIYYQVSEVMLEWEEDNLHGSDFY